MMISKYTEIRVLTYYPFKLGIKLELNMTLDSIRLAFGKKLPSQEHQLNESNAWTTSDAYDTPCEI